MSARTNNNKDAEFLRALGSVEATAGYFSLGPKDSRESLLLQWCGLHYRETRAGSRKQMIDEELVNMIIRD
ncbi:hypothetical protein PO909_006590 [Leuciscus waleckii]